MKAKPGRSVNLFKAQSALGNSLDSSRDVGPDLSIFSSSASSTEDQTGHDQIRNDSIISSTLAHRLSRGLIYTAIANRIIVALNPARSLFNMEAASSSKAQKFTGVVVDDGLNMEDDGEEIVIIDPDEESTHIFQLVESAFIHSLHEKKDQSLLLLYASLQFFVKLLINIVIIGVNLLLGSHLRAGRS
jgi:myosin heavy subunit